MLEQYFRYPKVLRRLRGGGFGEELDRIAAYLADNGYRRASAKIYLGRLARFSGSISGAARRRPITQAMIDSFVGERETETSRVAARTAIALARRVAPARFELPQPAPGPHAQLLAAYGDYLQRVRGLEQKTREGQILVARRMLSWWDVHRGGPLSTMAGADVLAIVEHLMALTANDRTRAGAGSCARRFLKFLRWADLNDDDLARFVPRVPCYRLAHLPSRLTWEDVRRAIDAIDVTTVTGVRDRAIVLLFATTGIRNKDCDLLYSRTSAGAMRRCRSVVRRGGATAPFRSCKRRVKHSPTISSRRGPTALVGASSCSIDRRCAPSTIARSFRASSAPRCCRRP